MKMAYIYALLWLILGVTFVYAGPPETIRRVIVNPSVGGEIMAATTTGKWVLLDIKDAKGITGRYMVSMDNKVYKDFYADRVIKPGDKIIASYSTSTNGIGVITNFGVTSQPLPNRVIELKSTKTSVPQAEDRILDLGNQMDAMNTNTRKTLFQYDYNSIIPYRYDYVPNLYSSSYYGWSGPLFKSIKEYERESGRPFKVI